MCYAILCFVMLSLILLLRYYIYYYVYKGGLSTPPRASIAQNQGLSIRATLKNNSDSTMRSLWEATSDKNIANDSLLLNNNVTTANKQSKNDLLMKSLNHVQNLQGQGSAIMVYNCFK